MMGDDVTMPAPRKSERKHVEFVRPGGGYSGLAAVDGNRVLFPGKIASMRGIKTGTVDGVEVRVVSVAPSELVPTILVVEFEGGAA